MKWISQLKKRLEQYSYQKLFEELNKTISWKRKKSLDSFVFQSDATMKQINYNVLQSAERSGIPL